MGVAEIHPSPPPSAQLRSGGRGAHTARSIDEAGPRAGCPPDLPHPGQHLVNSYPTIVDIL